MPIYIYDCKNCGKREDYLVKADRPAPNCYDCGKDSLVRVLEGQTFSARTTGTERPSGKNAIAIGTLLLPSTIVIYKKRRN